MRISDWSSDVCSSDLFRALGTPRRGSLDRLRLESVEHAPPRLTLTRGLRLLIAAADRPWIFTHFARISTARRKDPDPPPLRRIRHADPAQQPSPIGAVRNIGAAGPHHRIIRSHNKTEEGPVGKAWVSGRKLW